VSESPNIYQRINAVMKQIEFVQKDTSISGGGGGSYSAVSHDMVTAVLRKHLVEQGIVIHLEQLHSEILVQRKIEKKETDIKMMLYSGDYGISFVNIDNPEDRVTVTINAHAMDNGDKAPGKAASYATKMAMLKMFSLETGENDESRTHETVPYTPEQLAQFHEFVTRGKGIELLAMSNYVGPDVITALNGTFPAGKISEGKAALKKLMGEANQTINGYATALEEMIIAEDSSGALEAVGEFTKAEKGLVLGRMTDNDIATLRRMRSDNA